MIHGSKIFRLSEKEDVDVREFCNKFVRPDNEDKDFESIPYRARVMIDRYNATGAKAFPFSDYAIAFYDKYDKESYALAVRWNGNFSREAREMMNTICKLERGIIKPPKYKPIVDII